MLTTDLRPHVRWTIRRDLPEILAIENASFSVPWTEADFTSCMQQRSYIGLVVEIGEKVVAYTVYELRKHDLRIANLAVHPDYRRQGIGSQLIAKLIAKLTRSRFMLTADVRETNLAAQLFFRDEGFHCVGIRKGIYSDGQEDGLAFRFKISSDRAQG